MRDDLEPEKSIISSLHFLQKSKLQKHKSKTYPLWIFALQICSVCPQNVFLVVTFCCRGDFVSCDFLFSVFRRFQALKTYSLALARKTENKKPQETKSSRQQNVTTKKTCCGHS